MATKLCQTEHTIRKITNKMQTIQVNSLFLVSSTCFGRCFLPSSGALDCISVYGSIHPSCCRPVSWMSWNCGRCFLSSSGALECSYRIWYCSPKLLPAGVMDELKLRTMFSSIIRSTWLYLQYLVVFAQVAAGWCLGWFETTQQFQLIQDASRQQFLWTLADTVNTAKCSWWWKKTSPAVSTHPRHQSAANWVNNTRFCNYIQVLLIMRENIARSFN